MPQSFGGIQRSSTALANEAYYGGISNKLALGEQNALQFLLGLEEEGFADPEYRRGLASRAEAPDVRIAPSFDPSLAAQISAPAEAGIGTASRVRLALLDRSLRERGGFGGPSSTNRALVESQALADTVQAIGNARSSAAGQAAQIGAQTAIAEGTTQAQADLSVSLANAAAENELVSQGLADKLAIRTQASNTSAQFGILRAQALMNLFQTIFGAQAQKKLNEKDFFDKLLATTQSASNVADVVRGG